MTFPRTSAELVKNTSTVSPTTLPTVKDALDNLGSRSPSSLPVSIAEGGTGATTALAAFNALSPLTTLGDTLSNDGNNDVRVAVGAANTFYGSTGAAVPSWRTAAQVLTSLGIVVGTYTPTLTNVANLDASTAFVTQYLQVMNTVVVFSVFDGDATLAAPTLTQLRMTLPIASNFTSIRQLTGTANTPSAPARITADTTNDEAFIEWNATTTSNVRFSFTLVYVVV